MYEGIAQLKERWRKHEHTTKIRRYASLFVSPRGHLVAVASGNQITILQKDDDYQKPCGIFVCKFQEPKIEVTNGGGSNPFCRRSIIGHNLTC